MITASLDRIDNAYGYEPNNVQWVHKDVNWMKQDFEQRYFIELCKEIAKKIMLNLQMPVNQLGYGVASLNILKGLYALGESVSLFPIGGNLEAPAEDHQLLKSSIVNAKLFDPDGPSVKIWHQFDLATRVGRGKHYVFPIFELDRFTEQEKHHLSSADHIIVCSEWARDVVIDQIGENPPCSVVHLGVDRSIFHPQVESVRLLDGYTFVAIGKWEVRKGHDVIVEAFNRAFRKDDKVNLVMHCFNPFINERNKEWELLYKNSELGEKTHIIQGRFQDQKQVASLIAACDCGVFPSRAEGWNLELLECMSMGKPVITTAYSAHNTFANEKNANIIPYRVSEDAFDGVWFHGQGSWMALEEIEIDLLSNMMRLEYEKGPRVNEAGIQTAQQFSWTNSATQLLEIVNA